MVSKEIIEALRSGSVICFPTETVYGLGTSPENFLGVQKILELKSRPQTQGLPLILSSMNVFNKIFGTFVDSKLSSLLEKFWPGALTIVFWPSLEYKNKFQPGIFAEDGSLAVRVSSSELSRKLAEICGGAITATSANYRSEPAAISYLEAKKYFPDLAVIEGEILSNQKPSTIIDVRESNYKIIREGAISTKELSAWL